MKPTVHKIGDQPTEGYLVGYARVSTEDQNLEMQIDALRRAGVREDNLHVEKVSGVAKRRPELEYAIKDLRPGDTLVVWRLDRLARSIRDIYARLDQVFAAGASFRSLTEHFEMSTPMGRLYLHIAAAFAEFERQLIAQRTQAGIAAFRERTGRSWGRDRIMTREKIAEVGRLLNRPNRPLNGPQVAKRMNLSTASIYAFWKRSGTRWVRKRTVDGFLIGPPSSTA